MDVYAASVYVILRKIIVESAEIQFTLSPSP
jgi:hypothetical protein